MFSGSELPGHSFPATLPARSTMYQNQTSDDQDQSGMYDQLFNYCTSRYSSSTGGCESSPSSYSFSALHVDDAKPTQRSVSSHSLPHRPTMNNTMSSSEYNSHRLMDLQIDSRSTIRRVFSTGDLQLQMQQQQQRRLSESISSSPLWNESSSSSIIESMLSKACRYSAEEKKERIERYKSKRAYRNFNKKIKYACRKTLADSRPRIRGRFARNNNNDDEAAAASATEKQWLYSCSSSREYNNEEEADQYGEEINYELRDDDDGNWVDLFNTAAPHWAHYLNK